jgi:hypothetical protein
LARSVSTRKIVVNTCIAIQLPWSHRILLARGFC